MGGETGVCQASITIFLLTEKSSDILPYSVVTIN